MTNTLQFPLLLKRVLLLFSLIFTIGMINATRAEAARKNIDMTVKSTDGTVWRIKGWIEFDVFPPKMTGWDVTVTNDKGGNWHFKSKNSTTGGGSNLSDFEYDWTILSGSEQEITPEIIFNVLFYSIGSGD